MGTIAERKRKDGSTGYNAQIVIKRGGATHREARTFDRRQAAIAWIARREKELQQPGAVAAVKAPDPTLGEAIERYVTESRKAIGRTKAQVLRALKGYDIAARPCSEIASAEVVALARELSAGRQPQTVENYLSHLSAVFAVAHDAWGYRLSPDAMKAARRVTSRLGLASKSRKRDRRPTRAEMDRLMEHFGTIRRQRPRSMPMQVVVAFALFSTRRQEEIVTIVRADLDVEGSRVLVRDMKHPGDKVGNDTWCELPPEALAIVLAQPETDRRPFPYTVKAVSAAFTRACQFLGIEDLHFHDLRHEGISRLAEMGRTVPLMASVSGHRSWSSLQRYSHVRAVGDRWAGWPWLAVVTAPASPSPLDAPPRPR